MQRRRAVQKWPLVIHIDLTTSSMFLLALFLAVAWLLTISYLQENRVMPVQLVPCLSCLTPITNSNNSSPNHRYTC